MLLLGQNQFLVLVFIKTHYLYVTLPFHIQNDVIRNFKCTEIPRNFQTGKNEIVSVVECKAGI